MLGQFDEHSSGRRWVKEGNPFTFRSETRPFVDETDSSGSATFERGVEIVYRKADMMDAWAAFGDELRHWRLWGLGFEELDQGITGAQSGDSGPIVVAERDVVETEQVTVQRKNLVE
jgi:hypothetical protein